MTPLNVDQARFNMVEQQVRTWDVLDPSVLDVLAAVPREQFVPEGYRELAFSDVRIPLGNNEVMMPPNLEGRLLQALAITSDDRVLEIGTGSGFVTACLAKLAAHVTSVEIDASLLDTAKQRLADASITNVQLENADACAFGWGEGKRFDTIAVTGSIPSRQPALEELLEVGGRMFVVIGTDPIMQATLITRISEREWNVEPLVETHIPMLRNAAPPAAFEF